VSKEKFRDQDSKICLLKILHGVLPEIILFSEIPLMTFLLLKSTFKKIKKIFEMLKLMINH